MMAALPSTSPASSPPPASLWATPHSPTQIQEDLTRTSWWSGYRPQRAAWNGPKGNELSRQSFPSTRLVPSLTSILPCFVLACGLPPSLLCSFGLSTSDQLYVSAGGSSVLYLMGPLYGAMTIGTFAVTPIEPVNAFVVQLNTSDGSVVWATRWVYHSSSRVISEPASQSAISNP